MQKQIDSAIRYVQANWLGLLVFLAVLGALGYFARKAWKQAAGRSGVPGGPLNREERELAQAIAADIYEDVTGANFTHDSTIYARLQAASDRVFVGVFNIWWSDYGTEEGKLIERLETEWRFPDDTLDTIRLRANRLEIK